MSEQAPMSTLPLFQTPIEHMVRASDPTTSVAAAKKAQARSDTLESRVLEAFHDMGTLTDGELEKMERFRGENPNSLRTARSHLCKKTKLIYAGFTRGHPDRPTSEMSCWRVREAGE